MKNNEENETNTKIRERPKFSISLRSHEHITIPEVLPRKRLSILLWHLPKNNSIHPITPEEENSQLNKLNEKVARTYIKRFSMIDNSPLNKIQRETSLFTNNPNENFNRTLTNTNARMIESRMGESRMLYSLVPEDKPSYMDPELDFNYKDSEEKRMLYEQIRVIIERDDNEDFYKVGLLMEEENEENNDLWNIDCAEEYQKEYDHFTHLQDDQQFLYCERKTPFDLIKTYADPYPLLECRKSLVYYSEKLSFACKKIIKHPLFDNIVLLIIILNCLLLVFEDPTKTVSGNEAYLEQALLGFYSAEMALKIIGLGFICNKKSYLRDIWNVLDFFIVITSYLPVIFTENDNTSSFKFSSLRTFRVLRPLRTISSVKSLRNLLVTLISSIPLLLDILLFFLFFLLTYSMVAVHLFSGSLKYRCFDQFTGKIISQTHICGYDHCPMDAFCGKSLENPFFGMMNFDNIFFSLILCFQVVTLQSWTVVMFEIVAATSLYSVIFFISLVFFGTFFLLNLTLAVIKSKFTDTQKLKESLGKEVIKKVSEVQINELRLLKKMERSHYKRLKNQKKELGIGASEEGRPGTNKFDEITWEDLLQLKEMIREEKLREEEEERFQMMRRERVKSDEIDDEKKMIYYVRKVQNLKINALRLFLKKEALVKTKRTSNIILPENCINNLSNNKSNDSNIYKKNKVVPLETAKNGSMNAFSGNFSQPIAKIGNIPITDEIEIEDPSVFTSLEANNKDILSKGLTLSYKDLKFDKKLTNLPPLMHPPRIESIQKRRSSIKTGSKPLQTIHKALSINYNESLCFQETIKEDVENEIDDQENQENINKVEKNVDNNNSILINENKFTVLSNIEEKSSFESDLINDSDFNDSVTLNKAKLEWILQSQPIEKQENLENPSKDQGEEEIEGYETKNSDRPFMREIEKSTTAISQINEKSTQKINDSNKNGGVLKRTATKRFTKGNSANNRLNAHFGGLKTKFKDNKSKETLQKRPNIRDFNLMVDMDRQYIGYSVDDVLENRIFELIEKKKREEEMSIYTCKLPIELKPSTLKYQNKELLDQIKEKRKKILALKDSNQIKKRRLPLKSPFTNIISNALPTISLRRQYYPQKFSSFLKTSGNKSPKRAMLNNKRKKNQLKLDDDLDFNYTNIQQKINENMIPKLGNSLNSQELEEEYLEIHRKDRKIKKKSSHVWSGADVFPLKVMEGYWSMEHVNNIFKALSRSKQDKLIWLPTIYGKLRILHKYFERFLNGELFEKILLLIVVMNTIIMCFDGLFTDQASIDLQSRFFFFFNIFFVVEMGVKLMIFGFKKYLKDSMNIFDGVVSCMSLLELTIDSQTSVSFIKVFRVLRVTRLLRSITFMRMIVKIITRALKSFIYIALLLLLFMFIYTLLGMQIFGGAFPQYSSNFRFRENFDSFSSAFITVFQILTAIMWQNILYLAYVSPTNNFVASLYIVSWIFIGNYFFLNLFLAIILDEFTKDENYKPQNDHEIDYLIEFVPKQTIETNATSFTKSDLMSFSNENNGSSVKKTDKKRLFPNVECHNSLFLFSKHNKLRVFCYKLSMNQKMENFWLFVIIANSVKMIIDTYFLNQTVDILNELDYVFFSLFSLESIIKIIAFGFFMDKGSYLRDSWNVLDFIIVIFACLDISISYLDFSVIKGFRVLRMLRPLRLISHNVNMKIVVTALLDSITSILNVLVVILLSWLMFAILGMSLLKDKMGRCDINDYYNVSYEQCLLEGNSWKVPDINFDNIYYSMVSLFVISSREAWNDIMYMCIDAGDRSEGPVFNHYPSLQIYFMAFILIGSYFLLNLLVGVIFYNFNKAKRNEQNKSLLFLTEEQAKWMNIQKMMAQVKPDFLTLRKPQGFFRLRAFLFVTSRYYEKIFTGIIAINVLILLMYYDNATKLYVSTLDIMVFIFQGVYLLEFGFKAFGLGIKAYWYDSWNRFDFFLVVFSALDVIFWTEDLRNQIGFLQNILEITKNLRILRLLKIFKGAQKLLDTLIFSLPPLINVGALLLLIIFVYAVIGVTLFSNITQSGGIIDEYNNFQNFGYAMLVLFKVLTGDSWYFIMFELAKKPGGCDQTNTCGSDLSILYFLSFFLICTYIMLNLFILIIIQQFEDFHLKEDNPITNFKKNLDSFSKIWVEFTENSFGISISSKKLIDFYMKLEPPLGFGATAERPKVALEIMKMNLAGDEEGNIFFNELLFASMKRVFGQEILNNVSAEIKKMMENQEKQIKERLERRTLKMINSFYIDSPSTRTRSKATTLKTSPLKSNQKKQIVNPMITILFVGMVFKSWKKYCEHREKNELDMNGSVIITKIDGDEEDDDSEEEEISEESSESNRYQEKLKEKFASSSLSSEKKSSSSSFSSSSSSSSNEEEQGKSAEKQDKRELAFNAIDKFIRKKNIIDTETTEKFERKPRGNMFRTFFAANQNALRLKEN